MFEIVRTGSARLEALNYCFNLCLALVVSHSCLSIVQKNRKGAKIAKKEAQEKMWLAFFLNFNFVLLGALGG